MTGMENARSTLPFLKTTNDKYDVLYVNTPWNKLDVTKISKFPAKEISAENSALFIWVDTYSPADAMRLVDTWGFKFHSVYQIADFGQYPWMKKTPSPTPVVETGETDPTEGKPKATRKTKMPLVTIPKWWSSPPENSLGSRSTTEQLWLATKGDVAGLFDDSIVPSQVVNLPSYGKKNRSKRRTCLSEEWDSERPHEFISLVTGKLSSGKKLLDVFSSSIHENVDSWGPNVQGGFLRGLSSKEGLVHAINLSMRTMKKTQLQMIANRFLKYEEATLDEKKKMFEVSEDAWKPLCTSIEKSVFTVSYNWKTDSNIPTDWFMYLVQVLASKNISEFDSTRKKKRKRKVSVTGDTRPRHGIACPGKISPELADFFDMPHTATLARTVCVSRLNAYILKNNLQNPDRKVEIILDDTLKTLLSPPEHFGPVTYFNLCSLIGKHFPKKTDAEKKEDAQARAKKHKEERDSKKESLSMKKEDKNVAKD